MRLVMGIVRYPNGVFYARKKVPDRLAGAVAIVTNAKTIRVSWLKRSLGTKDQRVANIIGKPVLAEFDRILAKAEAQLQTIPRRDHLSPQEIDRIANYYYAQRLAEDDEIRELGTGSEPVWQGIAKQLADAGVAARPQFPLGPPPKYGLSQREMVKLDENIEFGLASAKEALAKGDISELEDEEEIDELLATFRLNLDRNGCVYRQLGMAVLRKKVAACEALKARNKGKPVETPRVVEPSVPANVGNEGSTLSGAFEGWKKTKRPSVSTVREFDYAIGLFEQLHGAIPVAAITRSHVRQYRDALQLIPVRRAGKLRDAGLLELGEWAKEHPEAPRISNATINKLLGGPMAIANWAYGNGIIAEDTPWSNPFSKMQLEVDEPEREPWEISELRTLFSSKVFAAGARPDGGRGEAAYWLPLLGIFTGARLGELASLAVQDVVTDERTSVVYLSIVEDEERGRRLKTKSSRRVVPVHPQLVKLGFLSMLVERRQKQDGRRAALFPLIEPGPRGQYGEQWSKWFGRYIRDIGIENRARVFHSLRHGFKDELRIAGISEDVHDALTGHVGGGVGRTYGAKDMARRFGFPRLAEAVSKVEYPGLDLSHLAP